IPISIKSFTFLRRRFLNWYISSENPRYWFGFSLLMPRFDDRDISSSDFAFGFLSRFLDFERNTPTYSANRERSEIRQNNMWMLSSSVGFSNSSIFEYTAFCVKK